MAVSVQCPNCRAKLSLKSEAALGKKVSCPKCKKPFKAETPGDEDPLAFLDDSSIEDESPPENEDEEQEPEEKPERRGRKGGGGKKSRKGGPNVLPWILGGVGLVVALAGLAGIGFLLWSLLNVKKGLDLAWIPGNAQLIVHARVGETLDSQFVKTVVPAQVLDTGTKTFQQSFGIPLSDIQSVTAGGSPPNARAAGQRTMASEDGSVVIRTKSPVDQEKVFAALGMSIKGQAAGKDYRVTQNGPGATGATKTAGYFVSSTMFVVAPEEQLKALLAIDGKAASRPEFDFIDLKPQVIVFGKVTELSQGMMGMGGGPGAASPLQGATAFWTGITTGADLDVRSEYVFASPDESKSKKELLDKQFEAAKQQIALVSGLVPPLKEIVNPVMDSYKTSTSGNSVVMSLKIPASIKGPIEKLLADPNMAGMLAGMGGAGGPPVGMPVGVPGTVPPAAGGMPPTSLGELPAGIPGAAPPGAADPAAAAPMPTLPMPAASPPPAATPTANPM